MARKASSFVRRPPKFKPQPRVLILCEDKKSCRTYLREAAQYFRCHADIELVHTGKTDPLSIVTEAKKRSSDYNQVFCAIDRDAHENFEEAVALAASAPTIDVIHSHPCYEYWLLLHFRKSRKPFVAAGGKSAAEHTASELRAEAEMANYAKGKAEGLFDALLERLPIARVRATQVLAEAETDGNPNPSTHLHRLIDLFESLSRPQPL